MILLSFLFISGCLITGPTYKKPHLTIPKHWPDSGHIRGNKQANLPRLYWWKQFNSPQLNTFIKRALDNNGSTKIAAANIELAQAQLKEVKWNWIPSASFLAGFTQFPIFGNPGTTIIAFPLYVINVLQQYKLQKSARFKYKASTYAKDAVQLAIIAQTASSYFTLLSQQESLTLYQQLINEYNAYLRLVKTQYRHGLTSLDQIEQLNSQLKKLNAEIKEIEHNIVVSKNTLRFLFNDNPGNLKVETSFKDINSNGLIPTNVPSSVLTTRPDVREAEALLKSANADIGATTAELLPSVSLGSFLGQGKRVNTIKLLNANFIGPAVDLPLFPKIKGSKARYKALYVKYIITVREALREVANDLSAYESVSRQLKNNREALNDEKKRCRLIQSRYRNGLVANMTPLACQFEVTRLELMISQNKLKKMLSLVTLYQDLGGGYRDA